MTEKQTQKVDRPFLFIVLVLALGGFMIFASAAMALLTRDGAPFSAILIRQLLALVVGLIFMFILSYVSYPVWRRVSLTIFILAVITNALLLIPGLGIEHGGATRWLSLGPVNFQPAEILKFGFLLYCAAWLSGVYKKIHKFSYGLVPLMILLAVSGFSLLYLQKDTSSLVFIILVGVAMFFAAGARLRDTAILASVGISGLIALILSRPYVLDRFKSFLESEVDPQGAGYQRRQALIGIGSGGVEGRGFGQGIQKFNEYLPEPMGDSVFAVLGEELGFLGAALLLTLFLLLLWRGVRIATRVSDPFGQLVVVGVVVMFTTQALINIGGMIGLIPLSGTPLTFVSQGGTALLTALILSGIVLNISRYQKVGRTAVHKRKAT